MSAGDEYWPWRGGAMLSRHPGGGVDLRSRRRCGAVLRLSEDDAPMCHKVVVVRWQARLLPTQLARRPAAVDGEHGAGNELGLRRAKIQHHVGDLFRTSEAADGLALVQ